MALNVVGFAGRKHVGKDTAAKVLLAAGWKRFSFGDRVKDGLLSINPIIGYYPRPWWRRMDIPKPQRLADLVKEVGWEQAKHHPEVRYLVQRYGTEGGRDIHGYDCWVNIARKVVSEVMLRYPVVITDVRFDNEAQMIREMGGIVIRILRTGSDLSDTHRSERLSFTADYTLLNDGPIAVLHAQVKQLIGIRE